jgi:hypothetical protein
MKTEREVNNNPSNSAINQVEIKEYKEIINDSSRTVIAKESDEMKAIKSKNISKNIDNRVNSKEDCENSCNNSSCGEEKTIKLSEVLIRRLCIVGCATILILASALLAVSIIAWNSTKNYNYSNDNIVTEEEQALLQLSPEERAAKGFRMKTYISKFVEKINQVYTEIPTKPINSQRLSRLSLNDKGEIDLNDDDSNSLYSDVAEMMERVKYEFLDEEVINSLDTSFEHKTELKLIRDGFQNFGKMSSTAILKSYAEKNNSRRFLTTWYPLKDWKFVKCNNMRSGCDYCVNLKKFGRGLCPVYQCVADRYVPLCFCDAGIACNIDKKCWSSYFPFSVGVCLDKLIDYSKW